MAQRKVARGMAHRIVDAFEVEIDHREDQHVILGPSEAFHVFDEGAPVGQAGEGVGVRHHFQFGISVMQSPGQPGNVAIGDRCDEQRIRTAKNIASR
jgi:hypothetical protein